MSKIYPFILCGGSGTRLWPISRRLFPKQFHKIYSKNSIFVDTLTRISNCSSLETPSIIANQKYQFIIKNQVADSGMKLDKVFLEPVGRSTCAAAVIASLEVLSKDREGCVSLFPSDHVIEDVDKFKEAIDNAHQGAIDDKIVTFGITPTHPETGFGYIKVDLSDNKNNYEIEEFVEKPDKKKAKEYLESGNYFWNGGIFLFKASTLIEEVKVFEPDLYKLCVDSFNNAQKVDGDLELEHDSFAKLPNISIDYAVMERTKKSLMVKTEFDWNDIGTWNLLWKLKNRKNKQADNNVVSGNVVTLDTKNSYLHSDGPLLTTVGIDNAAVIATNDAILVTSLDQDQKVSDLVKKLNKENRNEAIDHVEVYRPWGKYRSLSKGERFLVKEIAINPGGRLSLQVHQHRAEHWVVVQGVAKVTRDKEVTYLEKNQSTYIEKNMVHRLENESDEILIIVEIQTGSHISEDDITRLEDHYNRK